MFTNYILKLIRRFYKVKILAIHNKKILKTIKHIVKILLKNKKNYVCMLKERLIRIRILILHFKNLY